MSGRRRVWTISRQSILSFVFSNLDDWRDCLYLRYIAGAALCERASLLGLGATTTQAIGSIDAMRQHVLLNERPTVTTRAAEWAGARLRFGRRGSGRTSLLNDRPTSRAANG